MTTATRSVTFRDFAIFQLKLLLDGLKDVFVFNISMGAMVLDLLSGRGRRPRLFYSVLAWSERFDSWLCLHGAVRRLEEEGSEDGLFGVSRAGDDSLLGRLEMWAKGGDGPGEKH
ncbi:MAG: hypothetical protein ACE5GJ_06960 [Gemmatimonadota bacterium]